MDGVAFACQHPERGPAMHVDIDDVHREALLFLAACALIGSGVGLLVGLLRG